MVTKFVDEPIVITGMGCVTPVGVSVQATYNSLIENTSGISRIKNGTSLVLSLIHI